MSGLEVGGNMAVRKRVCGSKIPNVLHNRRLKETKLIPFVNYRMTCYDVHGEANYANSQI